MANPVLFSTSLFMLNKTRQNKNTSISKSNRMTSSKAYRRETVALILLHLGITPEVVQKHATWT
jgi:hypothetical protein